MRGAALVTSSAMQIFNRSMWTVVVVFLLPTQRLLLVPTEWMQPVICSILQFLVGGQVVLRGMQDFGVLCHVHWVWKRSPGLSCFCSSESSAWTWVGVPYWLWWLWDNFFCFYSFPQHLHSDQGANFESEVWSYLSSHVEVTTPSIKTKMAAVNLVHDLFL